MDPSELESRLKSLPLRVPSDEFGKPETLTEALDRSSPTLTLYQRISNMPWQLKSLGSVGIAASLLAVYLVFSGTSSSVAFAQVVKQLNDANTLSFDSETKSVNDGNLIQRSRNYYMIPGMHRMEMRAPADHKSIAVFNGTAGKVLMLDPKRKSARVSDLKGAAGNDMALKMIQTVQSLKTDEAKSAGEKQIGGKRATGMEFEHATDTTTVWTDVASGELIQVEIMNKNVPTGPMLTVWTNIKLDEELDSELFSIEPPTGYTVAPFVDIDMNASPAKYMSEFLKAYAKHSDGQFPTDFENDIQRLGKRVTPQDVDVATLPEEMMKLAFNTAAVVAVMRNSKEGVVWQYYPGHALGDKDEIVFWVRNRKDKEKYMAVFGDLRIEERSKKQLPPNEAE